MSGNCVQAGTPVISIFGKSWDLHTKRALGITEEENLALIGETVAYLKTARQGSRLRCRAFLRRLHVESGFRAANTRSRARRTAPTCCACATPTAARCRIAIAEVVRHRERAFRRRRSASTRTTIRILRWRIRLLAVEAGATHVQGCMNGYGERCGNANHRQRHRESRIEDGPRDGRPRSTCRN